MAMKHYEPGKPYHRPGQKKKKKNLRPLLALLALLVVIGLAAGLAFAWLNRHKAQVPEDVAPIVTEAPAEPTATPEPTAEPTPEPTAEPEATPTPAPTQAAQVTEAPAADGRQAAADDSYALLGEGGGHPRIRAEKPFAANGDYRHDDTRRHDSA